MLLIEIAALENGAHRNQTGIFFKKNFQNPIDFQVNL